MSLFLEKNPALVFADGFDEAIIGVLHIDGGVRTVYDKWAMVNIMRAAEEELSFEDAVEFLEYNVWCAYVGPNTDLHVLRAWQRSERKKSSWIMFTTPYGK